MQYVLTEDKYKQLVQRSEVDNRTAALRVVREVVLKATGFHCIHETPAKNSYCDFCPISRLKLAHEQDVKYDVAKLCCDLSQHYSK